MTRVPINFPVKGLSENLAWGEQEPLTSRDLRNVRAINATNGRVQGAQRSGLSRWVDAQVSGTNKIQDLNVVQYDSRNILWESLVNLVPAGAQEDMANAAWTASDLVITTNDTNAPDGTKTADLLLDTNTAGTGFIILDASTGLQNGQRYWFIGHAKLASNASATPISYLGIRHVGTNVQRGEIRVTWSTTPPTVTWRNTTSNAYAAVTNAAPVVCEAEENGFYRIGVGMTYNAALTNTVRVEFEPNVNLGLQASAWFWGADIQEGTNAGPYQGRLGKVLPGKAEAENVKTDVFGNVYVLDSKGHIIKYSSDLKTQFTIALPLEDQRHVVRALEVDEFGCIYAGVSGGGDQKKARIWKYVQLPDNQYELLWTLEPGQYTEEIKAFKQTLYTAQNDDRRKQSRVAVYDRITTRTPRLAWETGDVPVPHPIRGMDVNSVGDIGIAIDEPTSQETSLDYRLVAGREGAPLAFYPSAVDASMVEILHPGGDESVGSPGAFQVDTRLWSHYRASDIDTNDVSGDLEDGVTILRWRDLSGNERHLEIDPDNDGPTLTFNGPGGKPAVRFNGVDQALRSGINGGSARANRDQQRCVLPGYDNCEWLLGMMVRPEAASNQGCILSQQNTSTNNFEFAFWANRDEGSNETNIAYGQFSVYDDTTNSLDNATGTDAHPASGSFTNTLNNASVVTYLNNGNIGTPGSTYSTFRINGTTIEDNYFSAAFETSNARAYVGRNAAGTFFFKGDISELLVVYGASPAATWIGGIPTTDTYPIVDTTPSTNGQSAGSSIGNGLEQMEGYLAHSYGNYSLLPQASVANGHAYGFDSNGFVSGPPSINVSNLISPNTAVGQSYLRYPFVAKISSENGSFQWVVNENTAGATTSNAGGVGYGVVFDGDDNVISMGPDASATNGSVAVRKIIDNGTTATVNSNGAWTVAWGSFPQFETPRMAVDASNNAYIPVYQSGIAACLRVYDGADGDIIRNIGLGQVQDGKAVALPDFLPDYDGDLADETAPFAFLATDNVDDPDIQSFHKIPLVKSKLISGSPRALALMAVSQGSIFDVTSSPYTVPTNGSGALNRAARYVQSAVLYERLFYTDGDSYRIVDPRDGKVIKLEATVGRVPERAKLIEAWRGRLVLGRTTDEPHNWYMSRRDVPEDWDFFPFQPEETQAVAGNNSEAGLFPDILNSLIPYSEDLMIFGGDQSIYSLVGDPAAGGRFDLLTDKTGMSFGRPWTKDPNGILYFWGSRGGLYRMLPGGVPERVSVNRIERRLQDIDLTNFYVRLAYNYRDEGIHIFFCPFGTGGTQVEHFFYEIKTDSFWSDYFGTATLTDPQPTSIVVMDGDAPSDRKLLLGCEDGYIRVWDETARNDDQTQAGVNIPIDSYVTLGPLQPMVEGYETMFSGLTVVLGQRESGCFYELFAEEEPDSLGNARRSGNLVPGRNGPRWDRVRGAYCFLRLRNASAGQRWNWEHGYIHASVAGIVRPRR